MKKLMIITSFMPMLVSALPLFAQKGNQSSVTHHKNDGPNRIEEITIYGETISKPNTDALQQPGVPGQQGNGGGGKTPNSGNVGAPKPPSPKKNNPLVKAWKFCKGNFIALLACTAGQFVLEDLIDQMIDFNDGAKPATQNNVSLIAGSGNIVCQNCSVSVIPSNGPNGATNYTAIIREPNGTTHSGQIQVDKGK